MPKTGPLSEHFGDLLTMADAAWRAECERCWTAYKQAVATAEHRPDEPMYYTPQSASAVTAAFAAWGFATAAGVYRQRQQQLVLPGFEEAVNA